MARESYVFDRATNTLVPRDEFYSRRPAPARSALPCPHIQCDNLEVRSMVDGQIYTSKAALRRSYREKGYVEVGNEELKPAPPPKPDRKAIRDSVGNALQRVGISAS